MARYIGPKCKLARREGTDLFLKSGVKPLESKCKFQVPPGGIKGERKTRLSDYGLQLREKQKVKRIYGLLERQFRKYFEKADAQKGATGHNLLRRMEIRLDNVVYRLGFGDSRKEARQLVLHSHFLVNGKKVNISNTILRPGDEVTVRPKSQKAVPILRAMENVKKREVPDWLELNQSEFKGKVKFLPERNHVTLPIEENLVVELYSR